MAGQVLINSDKTNAHISVWQNEPYNSEIGHLFWITKENEVAHLCLTLCDPMDCSLPGSSVHGIFQARVLEWIAISFSRGSSRPRDWTKISRIAGRPFTIWATREAKSSLIWNYFICKWLMPDFPGGSDGKVSVYNVGDLGSSPGLGRSPGEGNGNPLQYYCLENPMDRGAW